MSGFNYGCLRVAAAMLTDALSKAGAAAAR